VIVIENTLRNCHCTIEKWKWRSMLYTRTASLEEKQLPG